MGRFPVAHQLESKLRSAPRLHVLMSVLLDQLFRRDTQDLNGRHITQTYQCDRGFSASFRYLRLRQTGRNSKAKSILTLSAIEFFWTLRTNEDVASLHRRLLREEEERRQIGEFHPCDKRPFRGIISHVSEECGGNVHTKGVVNITSSSNYNNQCHQVTDYGWNGHWTTMSEDRSWICFDFKDKTVQLTEYSLKLGRDHLHHWVIEGSNDWKSWTKLDRRDTEGLNGYK